MHVLVGVLRWVAKAVVGVVFYVLSLCVGALMFGTTTGLRVVLLAVVGAAVWLAWIGYGVRSARLRKLRTPGQKVFRQMDGRPGQYADGIYCVGCVRDAGHVEWVGVITFTSSGGGFTFDPLEPHRHEYGTLRNVNPDVPALLQLYFGKFRWEAQTPAESEAVHTQT
ncbi:hypothetical protein [Deinococcus sedimenti]|uniref:DUF3592 domain-containing protein n=1 Tax=Deinococcus sedimenti TaxID=1867090 RepID=A0ABQ2S9H2_9DEIO|nr:hypothetical protein [Deinococcus sedimenti]GGS11167.1 hypothetical protein GCM10008960_41470 [Deinococcus sedimenti]